MQKKEFFIIDGSSLLYRSYYGVRPLHTSTGIPTHALYGFCRTLKKITDRFAPHQLIVVWDSKGPTIRHAEYAAYKATRQAAPSDLLTQKEAIQEFLSTIGTAQLAKQGCEADDLIYSLVQEHAHQPITIITGDKDLHQLLSLHVTIFDPFKDAIISYDSFCQTRGMLPSDLLLYHALLGDSSDNIPGVKGIGEKTACSLAAQYHTLEALYAALDQVTPPRVHKALAEHRADAELSARLFTLRPIATNTTPSSCLYHPEAWRNAHAFFLRYEIKPLLPEGLTQNPIQAATLPTNTAHCITTSDELTKLLACLKSAPYITIDCETRSLEPFRDGMVGISCAYNATEGFYIPFGHHDAPEQLSEQEVLAAFKPLLEDATIKKVFHNAKFDCSGFAAYNITVNGTVDDTLIMASLLRKGSESISLKALSIQYLHEAMTSYEDIVKGKKTFADLPLATATPYAAHDAQQTWRLVPILTEALAQLPELNTLYRTVELPLSTALGRMEQVGVTIDVDIIEKIKHETTQKITAIESKIAACLAGGQQSIIAPTLNLNSPAQLEVLLFDTLKLPAPKKNSKTGSRSTDSEVLQELSKIHPIPGLIMQYRELNKLLNTYLIPLPQQINPRTGRVHTTYTQTITATGRLSSTNPNLQNIPTGSDIRAAFVAPEGHRFVGADYSQIELRILAEFSQDKALLEAFRHDEDIHAHTASLIFGVALSAVTPAQRAIGKKINFSIMYGLTPYGLSKDLGISPAEAKTYIQEYFTQYAGVKAWMDVTVEEAKKTGYVKTLLGRRRYVPGLHERNYTLQEAERRIAINTPIQGTSADLIKMAMLAIEQALRDEKLAAQMLLQIHDELVMCAPEHEVERVKQLMQRCMESVVSGWQVALKVALRTGKNWQEISK